MTDEATPAADESTEAPVEERRLVPVWDQAVAVACKLLASIPDAELARWVPMTEDVVKSDRALAVNVLAAALAPPEPTPNRAARRRAARSTKAPARKAPPKPKAPARKR